MNKNLFLVGFVFIFFFGNINAQDCTGVRYRFPIFTEIDEELDVLYGSNYGQDGVTVEQLKLDIYTPLGDIDTDRPLVLLAHGGSFMGGNKSDIADQCRVFASLGYVAVSMQYRLLNNLFDPELQSNMGLAFKKEVVRSVHDMRAAIRFFRKSVAEENNPYGINPDIIIVGGFSAGAILANHVTYMDALSKSPSDVADYIIAQGGVEGESGNEGYSSVPQLTLSWCGAIMDTTWIESGAQPYLGLHNTGDVVVPNMEGQPDLGVMVVPITLQGDSLMYMRTLNTSVNSVYKSYPGDGHCEFPQSAANIVIDFVYDQLCNHNLNIEDFKSQSISLSVYPNPAKDYFYLELKDNKINWKVEIIDLLGRTIYANQIEREINHIRVDASFFQKGMYVVKLTSKESGEVFKRIVIE